MNQSEAKLCFRTDMRVIQRGDTGILLWDANQSYVLAGRMFTALAPLLDGSRCDDEIVEMLADSYSAVELYHTLIQLKEKGVITTADHRRCKEAAAFWHALAADTGEVYAKKNASKVHLHVLHPQHQVAAQLEALLADSGLRLNGGGKVDLTVVLTDDYLRDDLDFDRLFAAGHPWLPVRLCGDRVWIGPLLHADDRPAWMYLRQRLQHNERAQLMLTSPRNRQLSAPQSVALPSLSSLGPRLAATEVLKIICADDSTLRSKLLIWDPVTATARHHPIPEASTLVEMQQRKRLSRSGTPTLVSRHKQFIEDGGYRCAHPEETWSKFEPFMSPVTGIVPDIERYPTKNGIHVFHTRQTVSGTTFSAGGKGKSSTQAKVSCCAEALERHCIWFHGDEERREARLSELGDSAFPVAELTQFSDAQYAARDSWNPHHNKDGAHWIPFPYGDEPIEWSPVLSLTHGKEKWLPTQYCYFHYPYAGNPTYCGADSNGCAAGNNVEEAILQGILELVERDAAAVWWYNRIRRPAIDLSSFSDNFVTSVIDYHERIGRTLVTLDITNDIGIPVVVGVSWEKDTGRSIHISFGAHMDFRLAVLRALTELNQFSVQHDLFEIKPYRLLSKQELDFWVNEATAENQPYVLPKDGVRISAGDYPYAPNADLVDDIEYGIEVLRGKGLEVLVLDATRDHSPISVVRVTIPGLRHFWARFRAGRLYDVPVQLGWLDSATGEEALNPTPLFF